MSEKIYVPGKGPYAPKIVIISDAPTWEDEKALMPLTGAIGKFTNIMLLEAGIKRDECWVTTVSKYAIPPSTGKKKIPFKTRAEMAGIDLSEQINELRTELSQLQPNIILALGGTALWALTGKYKIQKFRGSLMSGMGFKTIGTYHPRDILYQEGEVMGYWNKQIVAFDLIRAKKQSTSKELIRPTRNKIVCKNSAQLADFIKRHNHLSDLSVDIEARNCVPICIGLAFSKFEGLTVPLWNTGGISSIPDSDLVSIWILLAELLASKSIIGQNFGYDRDKIKRLGFIVNHLKSDTMLKAFTINPELPKNLAFLTSIYTEEPYYKDEGMYEGTVEDLFKGCALDACVTFEINEEQDKDLEELGLNKFYNNFIIELHALYAEIENTGFNVNEEFQKELVKKYIEWDETIRYQLFKITGEYVNSNSPIQVAKLLYDTWKIPRRVGVGEEVLTTLLNNVVKDPLKRKAIELILEDRRVKKTLASYIYSLPDFDGRMKTSYFLCLDTGRSSTTQLEPPIRPLKEYRDGKIKKTQAIGMAFQTITKHGDIGPEVRKILVPDDGQIFLQIDSSQAEARVIFLLAEDYEALTLIDTSDYHALTASWFVGGTEESWSKKVLGYEHPNRFLGKTLRHAGHLGAGKKRAAIEVNTQARKYKIDISISEAKAEAALATFHKRQPKIREVFHAEVRKCMETNRRLIAPVPYGIDAPIGGIRTFFERWGEELMRKAFSYIPQRTVSENTKGAALRIKKRAPWIKIIVEAHDALLVSVPFERRFEAAQILTEEFERPIDFSTCSIKRGSLVIPSEIEIGTNYKDLDKFKEFYEQKHIPTASS